MYNDDIKMVAEFTGDCVEDVKHYPMYKFMDSLEKAKKARQAKEVVDMGGIERYRKFFRKYDLFCQYFGQELVDKYLVQIPFRDIAEEKAFRADEGRNPEPKWEPTREFVRKGRGYMHVSHPNNPQYQACLDLPQEVWRIPNQYQDNCHGKLLKSIMEEKWPWLKEFSLQLYHLDNYGKAGEFYVNTDGKERKGFANNHVPALYVPFDAFVAGDTDAIVKRNVTYCTSYYRDKSGDAIQQAVYSEIPQRFLALTKENARKGE